MSWTATRVSADFFNSVQTEAGTLLNTFDVSNPVEPKDDDLITETTGGISVSVVPETQDLFSDIDNMPNNTMEGKDITGWTVTLSTTAVRFDENAIALALGASEVVTNNGISPRRKYQLTDYKPVYWVSDLVDETKLFVIKIDNAVSTGGFVMKTSKGGKGQISLELTGHTSLKTQDKIPVEFYIIEKKGDE